MLDLRHEPIKSLYVHVPFCARKCSYCAFYSEPSESDLKDRYVRALIRELETAAPQPKPETVFFGGGTPTLLSLKQWELVCSAMERLNLLGAAEWTVECNPATLSLDKAKLLRSRGVNRISMGVQSFDDTLLERLGRIHTRNMVFESFDTLRRAGFDNVNLDLMFAIPGQTLETWRGTLAEAVALGSEHLSGYEVIYEEDTPFFAQVQAGKIQEDEDLACAMYEEFVDRAGQAGLRQYEVANFAKDSRNSGARQSQSRKISLPRYACRHNVNYWRGGAFRGLGPSATSYVRGVRTKNWSNTRLYCELIETGTPPIESSEELPPLARAGEIAAFGLRMVGGWPFEQFQQTTGFDLREEWGSDMEELIGKGWGRRSANRFRLTKRGLRFADAAARLFLRS